MNAEQQIILACGVYILLGYGLMRAILWLGFESLKHVPSEDMETMLVHFRKDIATKIFLVLCWPLIVLVALGFYFTNRKLS